MPVWLPWAALLFSWIALSGGYFDVWWHVMGRVETFFTPPHAVIYSSVFSGGMTVLAYVLVEMAKRGRITPAYVPHIGLLSLAGTGSLFQLLAGVSDGIYHELLGFDITLWSPPHLLAIFGGIVAALGLAGLFAGMPEGRGRRLGHGLALAAALSYFLFALAEFDLSPGRLLEDDLSMKFRWNPYAAYYAVMVSVVGAFLLGYGLYQSRSFREPDGSGPDGWLPEGRATAGGGVAVASAAVGIAWLFKAAVWSAWAMTPAHLFFPLPFVLAAVVFDAVAYALRRAGWPYAEPTAASAWGLVTALVVGLLGRRPMEPAGLAAVVMLAVGLAPVASCLGGLYARKAGEWRRAIIDMPTAGPWSGVTPTRTGLAAVVGALAAGMAALTAVGALSPAALAHGNEVRASGAIAPDMHPVWVMAELAAVLGLSLLVARGLGSVGGRLAGGGSTSASFQGQAAGPRARASTRVR